MAYAILNTDNTIYKIEYSNLPDNSENYSKYNVLPVNLTVPSGYRRNGWIISGQMVQPSISLINSEPVVPQEVTRRQLFLAVYSFNSGLTRSALRSSLNNEVGLIEFDEALSFKRNHPLVSGLASQLGLNDSQVDQIFIDASKI